MENQVENPYKAPEADINTVSEGKLSEVFQRFSAWGVFGLGIITLGIYYIYWMYSRTQQLNERISDPIGSGFITATLILYALSFLSNFVSLADPMIGGALGLTGLPAWIMMIIWAFKMRAGIHSYKGIAPGEPNSLGPVLTFFFSSLYLQYKINYIIDRE